MELKGDGQWVTLGRIYLVFGNHLLRSGNKALPGGQNFAFIHLHDYDIAKGMFISPS